MNVGDANTRGRDNEMHASNALQDEQTHVVHNREHEYVG